MLIRIVRMEFEPHRIPEFRRLFDAVQPKIASFEGCLGVELFVDPHQSNVYYTHSRWISTAHLERYRISEFFRETWTKTRVLFSGKPLAYSLVEPDS